MVSKWKKDFPIFRKKINGKKLIYLDSAGTSQKPKQVISSESEFYEKYNSNIHRSVNTLSEHATQLYENSRVKTAEFMGAESEEVVFVRNATEGINLVAQSYGRQRVKKGDTILLTEMEHHSNIVPWQLLAAQKGAKIEYVEVDKETGKIDEPDLEHKLSSQRVAIFAFTHVSNVLGTVNNVKKLTKLAKRNGATVVLDSCQSFPHMNVNVKNLGVDFAVLSGHKMFAPTGIGALYGRKELLEQMPPFLSGGSMISTVSKENSTWNEVPWKFEAGTPNIAGTIALGTAIDYMNRIGMKNIENYNNKLVDYCVSELQKLPFIKIYPPLKEKVGAVAFNVANIHPHDVASVLDNEGIAIRTGHHCCQPLMNAMGVNATCRASFQIYNEFSDVDSLVNALNKCKKVFKL